MNLLTTEIMDVFARFDIHPERGFLFPHPIERLPNAYESWEQIADQLSLLISEKQVEKCGAST